MKIDMKGYVLCTYEKSPTKYLDPETLTSPKIFPDFIKNGVLQFEKDGEIVYVRRNDVVTKPSTAWRSDIGIKPPHAWKKVEMPLTLADALVLDGAKTTGDISPSELKSTEFVVVWRTMQRSQNTYYILKNGRAYNASGDFIDNIFEFCERTNSVWIRNTCCFQSPILRYALFCDKIEAIAQDPTCPSNENPFQYPFNVAAQIEFCKLLNDETWSPVENYPMKYDSLPVSMYDAYVRVSSEYHRGEYLVLNSQGELCVGLYTSYEDVVERPNVVAILDEKLVVMVTDNNQYEIYDWITQKAFETNGYVLKSFDIKPSKRALQ